MSGKSVWLLLAAAAFLSTLSAAVIKLRLETVGDINTGSTQAMMDYAILFLQSHASVLAVIVFNVSPLLSFIALNRAQLSLAYPVLVALQFIFIALFSSMILGELFTMQKGIAMGAVLVSLWFFHRSEKENAEG